MLRMRIQFRKLDDVRFISHLDTLRTISRALRRTRLPIALSQGFNPHYLISMGSALAVGVTSSAEYMDIDFSEEITVDDFITKLSTQLPTGLELGRVEVISAKVPSLMSQINLAIYMIKLKTTLSKAGIEETLREFYNQKEILVTRVRKNKSKKIDLKPLIRDLKVIDVGEEIFLKLKVQTGSKGNVRPEEVLTVLSEYEQQIDKIPLSWIHRQGLFIESEEQLFTPFDVARI